MITSLDDQVGRIVAALEKRGLRDNTLIIFSSDNGGPRSAVVASGAHSKQERAESGVKQESLPASNGDLRGGKGSLYEGGVRVPTIFNWPGQAVKPGVVERAVAHGRHHADRRWRWPGAKANPADKPLDGKDIWATVSAGKASPHDDILVNVEAFRGAIIKGKWKLVKIALLPGKTELFDLTVDRGEKNDVAAQNPDVVKRSGEPPDRVREAAEAERMDEGAAGLSRRQGTDRAAIRISTSTTADCRHAKPVLPKR